MVSKGVEILSLAIQYGTVAKQLFQYLVSSTKYINIWCLFGKVENVFSNPVLYWAYWADSCRRLCCCILSFGILYKVVSVIGLSSFALSFFHHHVSSPLHNTASVVYIFAGGGGGGNCQTYKWRHIPIKTPGFRMSIYASMSPITI